MSAKTFARDHALGKLKKLRRMRPPLVLHLPPPRNPVQLAWVRHAVAANAGPHVRSQGAKRRAEKVALRKLLRDGDFGWSR